MKIEASVDVAQQRRNWMYRIDSAMPRWGAWLEHLSNSLNGFDQWRPTVPDYLLRASASLEAELERYLEMAMNHLHDLWCIQAWLNFPEQDFSDHEPLLMNLLTDALARCGRILSQENIDFLPRSSEAISPQDWLNCLAASEFGRELLQSIEEVEEIQEAVFESPQLPPLPRETVFSSSVRSLEAAQSTYQHHLRQKQLITRLRGVLKRSPFRGMTLAHSQVATSLNESETAHVALG
jgi:hypothetical protein